MKLLILSENEDLEGKFEPYFDQVKHRKLSSTRINLLEGEERILAQDEPAVEYDSLLIIPKPELIIYSRVLLEGLEKELRSNLDSTSSYILVKKQYLYKVLSERDIPIPKTVVIGSEKSVSGIKDLNYPLVGRMYQGFKRREMDVLHNREELRSFCEPVQYGKEVVILQEFVEGEVFDCLVIKDGVIGLKLGNGGKWNLHAGGNGEKYYKVSSDLRDLVVNARKAVGSDLCRVKVAGNKVVNMRSDPQLERFKEASGKNTYKKVADLLKGEP